jgi:iron uptake system EfeUOB component EfeO/EfeM
MLRRFGVVAVVVGAALVLAAPTALARTQPMPVSVKIDEQGCHAKARIKAGPTTFRVTNKGSGGVNFQVLAGAQVLGQSDDVAPGLVHTFSVTLEPGQYSTSCSSGSGQTNGTLTVKPRTTHVREDKPERSAR